MKKPAGYEPPAPCADGEHIFHEHDHSHVPAKYRPRCSARFWCVTCKRWYDGERCAP